MADLNARGFNCRNCGAPVTPRGLAWTRTIVCPSCGALQDPRDPNVLVLQEADARMRITPKIPLGTRGHLDGELFEAIGFQYRTIKVEGETYGWSEYLLFNPYAGFRYLSEYDGHWNVIRTLHALPPVDAGSTTGFRHDGHDFKHFQNADATTAFVLGEFPWQVRAGDVVHTSDYVAPPLMLSAEYTADEVTWSRGEYTSGREIWKAFELPGSPPRARGVFANQPWPREGQLWSYWKTFGVLALVLLLVFAYRELSAAREVVFSHAYRYEPHAGEQAFVTEPFDVRSGPSNVQVRIETSLSNNWLYYELTLIDADGAAAFDTGKEVSYYTGRDSDGPWTEGSRVGETKFPDVPPGRYYLRVEPEGDPASTASVAYSMRVIRDVPVSWPYGVALGLLAVPPALLTWRRVKFEQKRWAESDHGG